MFTPPFREVVVNPTWAGDLAWEFIPYSCATAPDYKCTQTTGFAFKPSHPGDMAPELDIIQLYSYCITGEGSRQDEYEQTRVYTVKPPVQ
jgi:hypothetical protein